MKRTVLLVVALVVLAHPAAAADAGEGAPGAQPAADIAREVMSPFCPGVTLHDCPSAAADELRLRIEMWVDQGWGRDRIMDVLVAEYGEAIRAVPPAEGSGLIAWILPAIALLAGAVAASYVLRRWTRRRSDARRPPQVAVSVADRKRIDAELEALRGEL